jgi:hypothetical protein
MYHQQSNNFLVSYSPKKLGFFQTAEERRLTWAFARREPFTGVLEGVQDRVARPCRMSYADRPERSGRCHGGMRLRSATGLGVPSARLSLSLPLAERVGCHRRDRDAAVLRRSADGLDTSHSASHA